MLNPTCREFRARFEPRGERAAELEAHRRSCAGCGTWASRLEQFTGGEARAPLPDRLRERLFAIPHSRRAAVGCGDVERLYEATWRKSWEGELDPPVEEHLDGCGRCRALFGVFETTFCEPRRRMSRDLARRLRGLVERPRVPLFARDGRLAIAASAVLTASLMLLAGDATSVLDTTARTVSSRATVLAEAGEERGQALWETLADQLETGYERSRELVARHGGPYRELWHEARSFYENENWRRLLASMTLEGESDGEP